jgi:hypothetical protein
LAFGAAFFRAVRFCFLRSSGVAFFVFMLVFSYQARVRPAYFSTNFFNP